MTGVLATHDYTEYKMLWQNTDIPCFSRKHPLMEQDTYCEFLTGHN